MSGGCDKGSKDAGPLSSLAAIVILVVIMGANPANGESDQPTCKGQVATIVAQPGVETTGTDSADVIVGTSGPDFITGGAGDDLICGLGGDDVIRGAGGADRIFGAGGDDRLAGGPGVDLVDGGAGVDHCKASNQSADQTALCETD